MINVLFVCLGNICRSPMAEAVLQHLVAEAGLMDQIIVDSVGTGSWHVGEPAHPGTRAVLQRHGIAYVGAARQITRDDLQTVDYLIVMDGDNLAEVRRLDPTGSAATKLHRLLEFAPAGFPRDVPDPYYDGNFAEVYRLVKAGCRSPQSQYRSPPSSDLFAAACADASSSARRCPPASPSLVMQFRGSCHIDRSSV